MGIIICRTAFCPTCFKEARPRKDDLCLLYGRTQRAFKVHEVQERSKTKGFTPFIYKIDEVIGGNVTGWRTCSMLGCGTGKRLEDGTSFLYLKKDSWERFIYTINDWNALIRFKDLDYHI